MGGKPLEALALLAIGFRGLSMSPSGIGPVKAMILATPLHETTAFVAHLLDQTAARIRCARICALSPKRAGFRSDHAATRRQLDLILRRHEELSAKLSEGADGAAIAALSKRSSRSRRCGLGDWPFRAAEREIEGLGALVADPTVEAEMRELAQAELAERKSGSKVSNMRCASPCCRRTPPTPARRSLKCAREPAATRRPCSPAISSACIRNTPTCTAGGPRSSPPPRARPAS